MPAAARHETMQIRWRIYETLRVFFLPNFKMFIFLFAAFTAIQCNVIAELESEVVASLHSGQELISNNLNTLKRLLPHQIHENVFNFLRQATPQNDLVRVQDYHVTIPPNFYHQHILGLNEHVPVGLNDHVPVGLNDHMRVPANLLPNHELQHIHELDGIVLPFDSINYEWSGTWDDIQLGHRFAILRSKTPLLVSDKTRKVSRLGFLELLADANIHTMEMRIVKIRSFQPTPLPATLFQIHPLGIVDAVKVSEPIYHSTIAGLLSPPPNSIRLTDSPLDSSISLQLDLVQARIVNQQWEYKKLKAPPPFIGSQYLEFLSAQDVNYGLIDQNGHLQPGKRGKLYLSGWIKNENGVKTLQIDYIERAERKYQSFRVV